MRSGSSQGKDGGSHLGRTPTADMDLEYVISALSDKDCPLNEETGDLYQDVFYIHDIEIGKEYGDLLKGRILDELPNLVFSLLHVAYLLFIQHH